MPVSSDQVVNVLREVGQTVVLPRWQTIRAEDIEEKGPDELVTDVDRAAELLLSKRLSALIPGSSVIGEESIAKEPGLIDRLRDDSPLWIVDPIDGTANFTEGRQPFGLMAALLLKREPVLAVIYEPASGALSVAERGGGAYLDGVKTVVDGGHTQVGHLRGSALFRHFPDESVRRIEAGARGIGDIGVGHYCAAREYPDVVRGELDFALFWRAYPWDHIPGTLIAREAGAEVFRFGGEKYHHDSQDPGIVAVHDPAIFPVICAALCTDR